MLNTLTETYREIIIAEESTDINKGDRFWYFGGDRNRYFVNASKVDSENVYYMDGGIERKMKHEYAHKIKNRD